MFLQNIRVFVERRVGERNNIEGMEKDKEGRHILVKGRLEGELVTLLDIYIRCLM